MTELAAKIEAILFVSTTPVTVRALATACGCQMEDASAAVDTLTRERNREDSGIHLVCGSEGITLATNPAFASIIERCSKENIESELTRPSVETLTIIAYRGPITKPEIEAIRGMNCTLILRNLLLRGLIDETEDVVKLQPVYSLTNDALRYCGLHSVSELADYAELHGNTKIDALLAALTAESSSV